MSEPTAPTQVRTAPPVPSPTTPAARPPGWTPGRVASLVGGAVAALLAFATLLTGAVALTADRAGRDAAGFLNSGTTTFSTDSYALTSDALDVRLGSGVAYPRSIFGDLRFRITPDDPGTRVFVGIAPTTDAVRYLSGVRHAVVTDLGEGRAQYQTQPGSAAPADPASQSFWAARAGGSGTQTLTWTPSEGDWTVIVMRADAEPGLSGRAQVGADVPLLTGASIAILVIGSGLLIVSAILVLVPVARVMRRRTLPA